MYGRGDAYVVGEFVLAYLVHFTPSPLFFQGGFAFLSIYLLSKYSGFHKNTQLFHTIYRGGAELWRNHTPIPPSFAPYPVMVVENSHRLYSR